MTIVAVAGGTGNIGLAIVEALLATGKHTVYILSRTAHPTLSATIGAPILAVDYTSVDALVTVLEAHQIHTVISGIAMHSMDGTRPHEVELIRAADKSKATKRLVSSEWGIPMKEADIGAIPSVQYKVEAQKELEKTTDVEWTVFHCGFLMDYWGIPGVKSNMVRTPLVYWLDVANNAAAIPGSGEVKGVFTHTTDVARFVAANLEREKWERATYVYGDRVTWNEFLALAEEVKGTKFTVTYDSVEKLKEGETTELPGQVPLYQFMPKVAVQNYGAVFGQWFEDGTFDLKPEKFLNETLPEVKPMAVKEMLERAWKK